MMKAVPRRPHQASSEVKSVTPESTVCHKEKLLEERACPELED